MKLKETTKKLVFFDVDGTLSIPIYYIDGVRHTGGFDDWWLSANMDGYAYKDCKAPKEFVDYIEKLSSDNEYELFVITKETFSYTMDNKKLFINRKYPDKFDNDHIIGVESNDYKIKIMTLIHDIYGIDYKNITFWDDDLMLVIKAATIGFDAHHVSEMMEKNAI